jgi:pyruvate kinase
MPRIIATLPPYVDHRSAIIAHPAVDELRFNTASPLAERRRDTLMRLKRECGDKRLWIDLKGRQLRIAKFAYLPYAYVELTHRIRVITPTEVRFRDCVSRIVEVVDGNKLILDGRPVRVVGEGEPINILDPSLEVDGYLTESDREYVEEAARLGLHDFMLSFAERDGDVEELRAIDPKARIVAKIESMRGLDWMLDRPRGVHLMAARDDLYVNMGDEPGAIIEALREIRASDHKAIVASRLLESLEQSPRPSLTDITDVRHMWDLGYRAFMLSDSVCFRRDPCMAALPLLASLLERAKEEGRWPRLSSSAV